MKTKLSNIILEDGKILNIRKDSYRGKTSLKVQEMYTLKDDDELKFGKVVSIPEELELDAIKSILTVASKSTRELIQMWLEDGAPINEIELIRKTEEVKRYASEQDSIPQEPMTFANQEELLDEDDEDFYLEEDL